MKSVFTQTHLLHVTAAGRYDIRYRYCDKYYHTLLQSFLYSNIFCVLLNNNSQNVEADLFQISKIKIYLQVFKNDFS